jgi:hypothetical protein
MKKLTRFDSVVAEAPPQPEVATVARSKAAAKLALDGDEVIQFTIRPAWWFVPLVSLRALATCALLAAVAAIVTQGTWTYQLGLVYQALVAVAAIRVGVASLQWASQLYVLTNRRVLRFKGVVAVDVAECPLTKITGADLHIEWYQARLGIGSIAILPNSAKLANIAWLHIANAETIHERLIRAIRKAQHGDHTAQD